MSMNRVFLDANVLFSAAYGSPKIGILWDLARQRRCLLMASHYVIEEARHNLESPNQLSRLEERLAAVNPVDEAPPDLPCPLGLPDKDRPVLLAAIAAGATHLITGDCRHFGPFFGRTVQGVLILSPAEYVASVHIIVDSGMVRQG